MIDPAAPQDRRLDVEPAFALTTAQQMLFESFGFLRLRGLFVSEVHAMTGAFDEVFASTRARALAEALTATVPGGPQSNDKDRLSRALAQGPILDTYEHLNCGGHRSIMPWFLESTSTAGRPGGCSPSTTARAPRSHHRTRSSGSVTRADAPGSAADGDGPTPDRCRWR